MNYTRTFRRSVDSFCSFGRTANTAISDFDEGNIFLYCKNTKDVRIILNRRVGRDAQQQESIGRLYLSPNSQPHTNITKAEDLLKISQTEVCKVTLGNNIYYVKQGMIFDKDRNPIIIEYMTADNKTVLGIDYSIFSNMDEPVNRFIFRKLIPYLNTGAAFSVSGFSFMNLDQFFLAANPFNVTPELIQEKLPEMIAAHFTEHGYR